MNDSLIKAHLNLAAVLQNLEDLVKLDPEMAEFTRAWDRSIQFTVANGPSAYLEFQGGVCKHESGAHPAPTIKLGFRSPEHLNDMFDGRANPSPSLSALLNFRFLTKRFARLTERLEYYLKPKEGADYDEDYRRINTTLTLLTAVHAVAVLAELEPTSKKVAAHVPDGILQIEVLPDGPYAYLTFDNGKAVAKKGVADKPMAKMGFRNMDVANALLSGKLDGFQAVAEGDLMLQGLLPMVDNVNLILDRVERYLA